MCSRGEFKYSGVAILVHSRWIDQIKAFRAVSDRIAYVDLCMYGKRYRIISVYLPHAGYPVRDFNVCMDALRGVILEAASLHMTPIFGGDLNTEIHRGWRSGRLLELLAETGMKICNDTDTLPYDKAWTFRSCLGATCVLDYICAPDTVNDSQSEAGNFLDLSSDHRAVRTCLGIPVQDSRRKVPAKKSNTDWQLYQKTVAECPEIRSALHLPELEETLTELAKICCQKSTISQDRAWDSEVLQDLRQRRREATGPERAQLSKLISRKTREQLRTWKTARTAERLQEFRKLGELDRIHMHPVSRKSTQGPDLTKCGELLKGVYTSDRPRGDTGAESMAAGLASVPKFSQKEIKDAISHMKKNKAADRQGIVLEMFAYGGDCVVEMMEHFLNSILDTGVVPESWYESFFAMLPKSGDLTDAND